MRSFLYKGILFGLLSFLTLPVLAQETFGIQHEHESKFFVGGLASYWNDTSEKQSSLTLEPEFGYFLNHDWAVGMILGFEYMNQSGDQNSTFSSSKILPFVRYYYLHRGPYNLYLDSGVGFSFGSRKLAGVSTSTRGFEVGVRPGACIDLTEGLCLCLRLGFVGCRNGYSHGEEEGLSNNGYGFRFSPEELCIGLELEF